MRALFVAAALAALVLAPGAEAGVQLRQRAYLVWDVHHVTVWANTTVTPPESLLLRDEADASADGNVDEAERAAYEETLRARFEEELREEDQATMDGQAPHNQTATSVATRGLVGPSTSAEPFEIDAQFSATFGAPAVVEEHLLGRDTGPEDEGPIRVVVAHAFALVWGAGIDDFHVSGDYTTVDGRNDGATDVRVRFMNRTLLAGRTPGAFDHDPTAIQGDESRGPGVLAPLLAAFIVAWAARRRA